MEIHDITNQITIYNRQDLEKKFDAYYSNSSFALKSLVCLDLSNTAVLNEHFNLSSYRFLLIYFFHDLENEEFHFVGHPLLQNQTMISFSGFWKSAKYFEAEISMHFGVKFYSDERIQHEFLSQAESGILNKLNISKNFEYNEDFKEKNDVDYLKLKINNSCQLNENVNFHLYLNGRNVIEYRLSHDGPFMGLEYKCEDKNIYDVKNYISHLNIDSPFSYQILLKELELHLAGVKLDQYSSAQFMLLNELALIYGHLTPVANIFDICFEEKAKNYIENFKRDLYIHLSELDQTKPFAQITNIISKKFPNGWLRRIVDLLRPVAEELAILKNTITSHPDFISRKSWNHLNTHPFKAGLTGLGLRSFGVSYDIRKQRPAYFYNQFDLNVPLGVAGDSYDRLLIRFEELIESIGNIIRLIESFPVYDLEINNLSVMPIEGNFEKLFLCIGESASGDILYICHYNFAEKKIKRFHVSTPSIRVLAAYESFYNHVDEELMSIDWCSLGLKQSEVMK